VVALVVAVCTAAAAFVFRSDKGRPEASAPPKGTGAANAPMNWLHGSERDTVPDACETLSAGIAKTLAPGAEPSGMSQTAQSDQHSECAWSLYGSARSRQLTVELRAVAAADGTSATGVAARTFHGEWQSDRDGKDLADTAKVQDSRGVSGVGEQAYVVYTVDGNDEIGEAVANARLANVLVTVHYSGGDDRDAVGTPIPSGTATDGALSAARNIISKLESHA
jgi:hypothetical protein